MIRSPLTPELIGRYVELYITGFMVPVDENTMNNPLVQQITRDGLLALRSQVTPNLRGWADAASNELVILTAEDDTRLRQYINAEIAKQGV